MSPNIATPSEWLTARLALLEKEKAHALQADAIAQELRDLPMVPVTTDYRFDGPNGASSLSLTDLFEGRSQLIIYHYMFGPELDEGCKGCGFMVGNFPDARYLAEKDTTLAVVSRAPISRISAFRTKNVWTFPWYSTSPDSSFNYDFHVTLDETVKTPAEYNYARRPDLKGDYPGFSVFKLGGDEGSDVYHTYSTYQRLDRFLGAYSYLDMTPAGRQEGEMGPAGFKLPWEYEQEDREKEKEKEKGRGA